MQTLKKHNQCTRVHRSGPKLSRQTQRINRFIVRAKSIKIRICGAQASPGPRRSHARSSQVYKVYIYSGDFLNPDCDIPYTTCAIYGKEYENDEAGRRQISPQTHIHQ